MTDDADLVAALLAEVPPRPSPPPEPCPDDPRPRYECHECQWGCQTPPGRCPKCGCCQFDRNDAYTPPEDKDAALKARAARAMAEDAEARKRPKKTPPKKRPEKRAESAKAVHKRPPALNAKYNHQRAKP